MLGLGCCVGLSLVAASRAFSGCGAWASHCAGFSCCRAQALGPWTSVVAARGLSSGSPRALEHSVNGCGAQASLLCGMWGLPGLGIEPMSPALVGGFFTTEPPGKPLCVMF